jgi:hypothetical protein
MRKAVLDEKSPMMSMKYDVSPTVIIVFDRSVYWSLTVALLATVQLPTTEQYVYSNLQNSKST